MKKALCTIMAALLVLSCQEEELCNSTIQIEKPLAGNTFAISVDSALANLASYMADEGMSITRSVAARVVGSVTPIKYRSKMTRSTDVNVDCENLLYIANFENEQGYAILAGDTRIGDEVLAVVDEGSLSEAAVSTVLELVEEDRIIYEGYPLTGPGFFTIPETGDELYMNPNTVDLYDSSVDDTLVGNFSLDIEESDSLVLVNPPLEPELIPAALCVSYALNSVGVEGPYDKKPVPDDDAIIDVGGVVTITTETTTSNWSVKEKVYPILTKYVSWSQGEPFSDLCPLKQNPFDGKKEKVAYAGCFPLAIAKIMTHFEFPLEFPYEGYIVNWKELKRTTTSFKTTVGGNSAAHLLRGIGDGCDSWYLWGGTFTFPKKARAFMRAEGYKNVEIYKYNFDRVKNMLDNACPVIIYSVPNINIPKSHCWNIDGYKIKERTITTKTYKNGTLCNTKVEIEKSKMVHCDFGWYSKCNGYYVSGVFKLGDSSVEKDYGTVHDKDTNYNNYLHIMTYDKP